MYLIVGLGNPGRKYEHTRHNVGFRVLNVIADKLCTNINKVKFKGVISDGNYDGHKVLLLKPQTYMNLSGQSVVDVVNFYKISINKIIVVYDDMDIPLGKIRIRPGGSSGGHKGIDSIIYNLSTNQFSRLRVGIDKPKGEYDAADYVLGKFPSEDVPIIDKAVQAAAEASLFIVRSGIDEAMNKYNGS
jgi:PTH1 family peptidyl-tRNA hydrolase